MRRVIAGVGSSVFSLYSFGVSGQQEAGHEGVVHDVTNLAFVPLPLVPLEVLLCIESVAADALASLNSMCFSH